MARFGSCVLVLCLNSAAVVWLHFEGTILLFDEKSAELSYWLPSARYYARPFPLGPAGRSCGSRVALGEDETARNGSISVYCHILTLGMTLAKSSTTLGGSYHVSNKAVCLQLPPRP